MIETNVSRLEELIRDLLDLSRLESKDTGPTIAPVSMQGLIDTLNREFQQACNTKNVSLSFEIDSSIQTLHTDGRPPRHDPAQPHRELGEVRVRGNDGARGGQGDE
jgi:signal transduction histidine kinase